MKGKTRTGKTALDLARKFAATVYRESHRAEVSDTDVEADCTGGVPSIVINDAGFLATYRAVDSESRLGVELSCTEGEERNTEKSKKSAFHVPPIILVLDQYLLQTQDGVDGGEAVWK